MDKDFCVGLNTDKGNGCNKAVDDSLSVVDTGNIIKCDNCYLGMNANYFANLNWMGVKNSFKVDG